MAVIPVQGTGLRHVRKTVAFDGSANNGQLDDYIPVFTTSGTVNITMVTIYCSEGLVCTAPTSTSLRLNAVDGNRLVGGMSSDGYAGAFWNDSYGEWRAIGSYQDGTAAVADELKLLVKDDGGGADVTDGMKDLTIRRPTFCPCGRRGPDTDAPVGSKIWARCERCKLLQCFVVKERV